MSDIEFIGGPLDGMFCPDGEMAEHMQEEGVITIQVEECDEIPGGCCTYVVKDGKAEWMAAYEGQPN